MADEEFIKVFSYCDCCVYGDTCDLRDSLEKCSSEVKKQISNNYSDKLKEFITAEIKCTDYVNKYCLYNAFDPELIDMSTLFNKDQFKNEVKEDE